MGEFAHANHSLIIKTLEKIAICISTKIFAVAK